MIEQSYDYLCYFEVENKYNNILEEWKGNSNQCGVI